MQAAVPDVAAAGGLYLPTAPSGSGGQDTIESATGTRCSQSMNSNGPYLDLGVAADTNAPDIGVVFNQTEERNAVRGLAYARVIIPLGERPRRIDCARLYEMELARMRAEIDLLRMNIE
jgi:hypothetical protein